MVTGLKNSLIHYIILLIDFSISGTVFPSVSGENNCFCGYRKSGLLLILRCHSKPDSITSASFQPVSCTRIENLIRIGDHASMKPETYGNGSLGMTMEPYGFSDLGAGPNSDGPTELQLNIPLNAKLLDAFSFAGLEHLRKIQAWRFPLALDSCSLVGLSQLEEVVLNCSSLFDRYLAFGASFKSIRLIGCRDLPLQFICTQCSQQPSVKVLRILSGPPSHEDRVSFEVKTHSDYNISVNNGILVGKCLPGICSDEQLCRNNYAFKYIQEFFQRIYSNTPVSLDDKRDLNKSTSSKLSRHNDTILSENILLQKENKLETLRNYFTIAVILSAIFLVLLISAVICIYLTLRITGVFGSLRRRLSGGLSCNDQPSIILYSQINDK